MVVASIGSLKSIRSTEEAFRTFLGINSILFVISSEIPFMESIPEASGPTSSSCSSLGTNEETSKLDVEIKQLMSLLCSDRERPCGGLVLKRNPTGGISALIEDTAALTSIRRSTDLKQKEQQYLKHVGDAVDIPVYTKDICLEASSISRVESLNCGFLLHPDFLPHSSTTRWALSRQHRPQALSHPGVVSPTRNPPLWRKSADLECPTPKPDARHSVGEKRTAGPLKRRPTLTTVHKNCVGEDDKVQNTMRPTLGTLETLALQQSILGVPSANMNPQLLGRIIKEADLQFKSRLDLATKSVDSFLIPGLKTTPPQETEPLIDFYAIEKQMKSPSDSNAQALVEKIGKDNSTCSNQTLSATRSVVTASTAIPTPRPFFFPAQVSSVVGHTVESPNDYSFRPVRTETAVESVFTVTGAEGTEVDKTPRKTTSLAIVSALKPPAGVGRTCARHKLRSITEAPYEGNEATTEVQDENTSNATDGSLLKENRAQKEDYYRAILFKLNQHNNLPQPFECHREKFSQDKLELSAKLASKVDREEFGEKLATRVSMSFPDSNQRLVDSLVPFPVTSRFRESIKEHSPQSQSVKPAGLSKYQGRGVAVGRDKHGNVHFKLKKTKSGQKDKNLKSDPKKSSRDFGGETKASGSNLEESETLQISFQCAEVLPKNDCNESIITTTNHCDVYSNALRPHSSATFVDQPLKPSPHGARKDSDSPPHESSEPSSLLNEPLAITSVGNFHSDLIDSMFCENRSTDTDRPIVRDHSPPVKDTDCMMEAPSLPLPSQAPKTSDYVSSTQIHRDEDCTDPNQSHTSKSDLLKEDNNSSDLGEVFEVQVCNQPSNLPLVNLKSKFQPLLDDFEKDRRVRQSLESELKKVYQELEESLKQGADVKLDLKEANLRLVEAASRLEIAKIEAVEKDAEQQRLKGVACEVEKKLKIIVEGVTLKDAEMNNMIQKINAFKETNQWFRHQLITACQTQNQLEAEKANIFCRSKEVEEENSRLKSDLVESKKEIQKLRKDNREKLEVVKQNYVQQLQQQKKAEESLKLKLQDQDQMHQQLNQQIKEQYRREQQLLKNLEEKVTNERQNEQELVIFQSAEKAATAALKKIKTDMEIERNEVISLRTAKKELENERAMLKSSVLKLNSFMSEKERMTQKQISELQLDLKKWKEHGHAMTTLREAALADAASAKKALSEEVLRFGEELKIAKKEKSALEAIVVALRNDMGKVEQSFKTMRCELDGKAKAMSDLEKELHRAQNEMRRLNRATEPPRSDQVFLGHLNAENESSSAKNSINTNLLSTRSLQPSLSIGKTEAPLFIDTNSNAGACSKIIPPYSVEELKNQKIPKIRFPSQEKLKTAYQSISQTEENEPSPNKLLKRVYYL